MMWIEVIRDVLMWCTIINVGILVLWFAIFSVDSALIYRFHGKWFPMSRDTFNVIHYSGIMLFKLTIIVFNLVPYIALLIVG